MKVYKIQIPFSQLGFGLCNQLCLLVNGLEEAVRILSLGNGVILKKNIKNAYYDGEKMTSFPTEGYHPVDGVLIGYPKYLRHPKHRLDIEWVDETQVNFLSLRGHDNAHWLDDLPEEVHVHVDLFRTDCFKEGYLPFDQVLDLEKMNNLLVPFRIKIKQLSSKGHSLDIMLNANCPRRSMMFRILISMIHFRDNVIQDVKTFGYKNRQHTQRTSVIHIRNAEDAIEKWAAAHKDFKTMLDTKYTDAIQKAFGPEECDVIVLTENPEQNSVVEWMRQNGYHVHYLPKPTKERELNAICDLQMGRFCDHTFIGACNVENTSGSSFSYFLFCMMPPEVVKICIDLDHMERDPSIHHAQPTTSA